LIVCDDATCFYLAGIYLYPRKDESGTINEIIVQTGEMNEKGAQTGGNFIYEGLKKRYGKPGRTILAISKLMSLKTTNYEFSPLYEWAKGNDRIILSVMVNTDKSFYNLTTFRYQITYRSTVQPTGKANSGF
jgi:hypothetical protein